MSEYSSSPGNSSGEKTIRITPNSISIIKCSMNLPSHTDNKSNTTKHLDSNKLPINNLIGSSSGSKIDVNNKINRLSPSYNRP